MKIYIMYNSVDEKFVKRLKTDLGGKGCEVFSQNPETEGIRLDSDYEIFIVVLSKRSLKSGKYQDEILNIRMIEEGENEKGKKITLISVTVEDCYLPILLISKENFNFIDSYDVALDNLFKFISEHSKVINQDSGSALSYLNSKYNNGELTLFCGSGISAGSGLPTWDELIQSLLIVYGNMRWGAPSNTSYVSDVLKLIPTVFQTSYLVLGQFLQTQIAGGQEERIFTEKFYRLLKSELYSNKEIKYNTTLEAVATLCKGDGLNRKLNSVVTLNYDDLLEQKLKEQNMENFVPIANEGWRISPGDLPIFHVHGYLPRDSDTITDCNIVFGEGTYHAMNNDPYCWQNRVQMDYLCRNTCLFMGLSMNDPNLRRLLSITKQKCRDNSICHYIIKKKNTSNTILSKLKKYTHSINQYIKSSDEEITPKDINKDDINKLTLFLKDIEEEDAEYLGLKTILINDYSEITDIADKIRAEN